MHLELFEKKFKIQINDLTRHICKIKSGTKINIGYGNSFIVEQIDNWERAKSKKSLIAFAFDEFGNILYFDAKDKMCPVYVYDHETMVYDLMQSSIINFSDPLSTQASDGAIH